MFRLMKYEIVPGHWSVLINEQDVLCDFMLNFVVFKRYWIYIHYCISVLLSRQISINEKTFFYKMDKSNNKLIIPLSV